MAGEFYSLPMMFGDLIRKKDLPKCSLLQSVAQNIHLILTSKFGENRNDASYGCSIWEDEFEVLQNVDIWKDNLNNSIRYSLQQHEMRLTNIKVIVAIKQEEIINKETGKEYRVKRRVEVTVTGNLLKTNESCSFNESFFIGPISYE